MFVVSNRRAQTISSDPATGAFLGNDGVRLPAEKRLESVSLPTGQEATPWALIYGGVSSIRHSAYRFC
jgi:hypothetical protein